ncbi:hypothetical protein R84981_002852 [Carnimonas sp. R-84981]
MQSLLVTLHASISAMIVSMRMTLRDGSGLSDVDSKLCKELVSQIAVLLRWGNYHVVCFICQSHYVIILLERKKSRFMRDCNASCRYSKGILEIAPMPNSHADNGGLVY